MNRGRPRESGNFAYRKAVAKLNDRARRVLGKNTKKFLISEAHDIFKKHNGRCVYCGEPLQVRLQGAVNSLNFVFYIPIEFSGLNEVNNIIPVCPTHVDNSNPNKQFLEDIPDINSIADIIEVLVYCKQQSLVLQQAKNPEYFPVVEKLKRVKRLLNFKIQEFALSMRYKTFTDWVPSQYELIQEDHNTIADLVEIAVSADRDSMDRIKDKMPETEECQVINHKDSKLTTVGIIHILCKQKTPARGYLFYCEPCDKLFPEKYLKTLLDLKKCFDISGVRLYED